eukprot:CAMPEP_0206229276 /NCGR_PEP_ID=MMETSP0047_2-20121206/9611_1 /ASSEMBLY_ACC=CAM_ASM_000192 /TAXON_ID=195065 /ORGANISM="Chroomonas mesostigmatica_cf, Strain CCMP1168" /LENGTH=489 /DNA_ID=CAMNT_0053652565 /DNA_START=375 /DNA_END=1841 /DNA_ORIENTATION=+
MASVASDDESEDRRRPGSTTADAEEECDSSLPVFVAKLVKMLSKPQFQSCIQWGSDGTTIVVPDIVAFSNKVLPQFFKHSNFASFVRQLNVYGFHKTTQESDRSEFQNKFFRKDQPDLMKQIKRKSSEKQQQQQGMYGGMVKGIEIEELVAVVGEMKSKIGYFETILQQKEIEKQIMTQEIAALQQHRQLHEENISRLAFVLMKACNEISSRSSVASRKRPRSNSKDDDEYGSQNGHNAANDWMTQLTSIGNSLASLNGTVPQEGAWNRGGSGVSSSINTTPFTSNQSVLSPSQSIVNGFGAGPASSLINNFNTSSATNTDASFGSSGSSSTQSSNGANGAGRSNSTGNGVLGSTQTPHSLFLGAAVAAAAAKQQQQVQQQQCGEVKSELNKTGGNGLGVGGLPPGIQQPPNWADQLASLSTLESIGNVLSSVEFGQVPLPTNNMNSWQGWLDSVGKANQGSLGSLQQALSDRQRATESLQAGLADGRG